MNHSAALTAAALAAVLAMTGCAGSRNEVFNYEDQKETTHTLRFFGYKYEAANVEVIEDILNSYMDQRPDVMVTYESLKGQTYYQVLKNREASGNLDDVFMVDHDTVLDFSGKGRLADLTELVSQVPFSDSMLDQMRSPDGKIYWVPTTVSAFGMYCNLDLLEAHGQKVPENLGEWEAVCDYFVSQGITPVIANNNISLKTLALARGFCPVYREGRQKEVFARLNSGQEKLSDYLTEGFALAAEFCEKGYIDGAKSLETEKTSDDLDQFVLGESPFMLTGVWAAERVRRKGPDFRFQVVPYPVLEDGAVLVINPDVRLAVLEGGGNQELAEDFVSCFLIKGNIRRFADNQSSFGPLKDNYEPSLQEIQEIVKAYHSQTPVIGSDDHLRFPIWEITADASVKVLAGENVELVMAWMDSQVESYSR